VDNFLKLICETSAVYGSSNNLELGLHLLTYFKGDIKSTMKVFFDKSFEVEKNHPISNYKYSGEYIKY
jgi:hypothetical protein